MDHPEVNPEKGKSENQQEAPPPVDAVEAKPKSPVGSGPVTSMEGIAESCPPQVIQTAAPEQAVEQGYSSVKASAQKVETTTAAGGAAGIASTAEHVEVEKKQADDAVTETAKTESGSATLEPADGLASRVSVVPLPEQKDTSLVGTAKAVVESSSTTQGTAGESSSTTEPVSKQLDRVTPPPPVADPPKEMSEDSSVADTVKPKDTTSMAGKISQEEKKPPSPVPEKFQEPISAPVGTGTSKVAEVKTTIVDRLSPKAPSQGAFSEITKEASPMEEEISQPVLPVEKDAEQCETTEPEGTGKLLKDSESSSQPEMPPKEVQQLQVTQHSSEETTRSEDAPPTESTSSASTDSKTDIAEGNSAGAEAMMIKSLSAPRVLDRQKIQASIFQKTAEKLEEAPKGQVLSIGQVPTDEDSATFERTKIFQIGDESRESESFEKSNIPSVSDSTNFHGKVKAGIGLEGLGEDSRASSLIWDENSMDVPPSEGSAGFTFSVADENSMDMMATNENSMDLVRDESSVDFTLGTNENSMDVDQAKPSNEDAKATVAIPDDKSQSSRSSSRRRRGSPVVTVDPLPHKEFTATQLFEYQWPQDKTGEWFMLQEQISEYLGILSFKRKYPDLQRRPVYPNERVFLREKLIVTEMQCDLGLTALKVDEVCDLLAKDYPDKYKAYVEILREREKQRIKDQHKGYDMPTIEKSKMDSYIKKAVKSAAEFNALFNKERREERRAYFDLQTMEVHYPVGTQKRLPPEATEVSAYPVALIPGQFQDYYKKYTPQEMKYFPLNTAMYSPPRCQKDIFADPAAGSEEDEEEDGEDGKKLTTAETEDDGSSSSSDSSDNSSDESDKDAEATTEAETTDTASQKSDRSTPKSAKSSRTPTRTPTRTPSRTPGRTPKSGGMKSLAREVLNKVLGSSVRLSASGKPLGRPPGKPNKKKDVIPKCSVCKGTANRNKKREAEALITCSECGTDGHPTCLELTADMVTIIKTYSWQCMDCKTCSKCHDSGNEEKMMFCDQCDRGYHTFCLGLSNIPIGRWECPSCTELPGSTARTASPAPVASPAAPAATVASPAAAVASPAAAVASPAAAVASPAPAVASPSPAAASPAAESPAAPTAVVEDAEDKPPEAKRPRPN